MDVMAHPSCGTHTVNYSNWYLIERSNNKNCSQSEVHCAKVRMDGPTYLILGTRIWMVDFIFQFFFQFAMDKRLD